MFTIIVRPDRRGAWRVTFHGPHGWAGIDGVSKADVHRIIARATNGMRPA